MFTKRAEAIALAIPRPEAASQELVWPLLVALSTAAAMVPLWAGELLPYQDAPQHIAAVRVLADYHTPGFGFEKWFELDLGRLQYLGFYLPAAGIAKLTGPVIAVKLTLSLIAIATSAAFWMFLGVFGRDRRLAVFAPAVILFGAWALQALATRDGPGAPARTPPHWLGLKNQVLDLLRFGNV